MTYEKMTGEINLEELEVQAEEVTEASAGFCTLYIHVLHAFTHPYGGCLI